MSIFHEKNKIRQNGKTNTYVEKEKCRNVRQYEVLESNEANIEIYFTIKLEYKVIVKYWVYDMQYIAGK